MSAVICTLFEGHYHYGLAGLSNSLYKNGFRGSIFAGYRGALPDWASKSIDDVEIKWSGTKTLAVGDGMQIHFLPVDGKTHFTNYKPDFMLKLMDGVAKDAPGIFYFDPDIVVRCKWSFFEKWINHGVALVHEIIANDMTFNHPVRREWEKVIESCEMRVTKKLSSYINAGFIGVSKQNIEFLQIWSLIMHKAVTDYGFSSERFEFSNRTELFFAGDQDGLNIAAMCCESPLSEIGPEGMDFIYGGFTMSHAVGSPKPWKKKYLSSVVKGYAPSMADKEFWPNMEFPIRCFSDSQIKLKQLSIRIAALIGRFYQRS